MGLVTGTCFSDVGNQTICVDVDEKKIDQLNHGISPIYEPGLDDLIRLNVKAGRLRFTTDLKSAVEASDLLFIAVGTPPLEDGSADLKHVLSVAETIGQFMKGYCTVVVKSTVPVGTCAKVENKIDSVLKQRGLQIEYDVVSNPEFLKEGSAIEDCLKPSRVVVGCRTDRAKKLMKRLYDPFLRNGNPFHSMDLSSSEMTKYAANSMLATKISFMNELSRVCEIVGADIESVRQGIGSDPRIGYQFIYPGLGYGGSCFPKDVNALIETASSVGEEMKILKAVELTNQLQRTRFLNKIVGHFEGDLRGKKIAFWGLSFKPGTDDIREAPAIDLIEKLLDRSALVFSHDPVAMEATRIQFASRPNGDRLQFSEDQYAILEQADALCIATEWKPFREPNFDRMKTLMKFPVIFDGRNLYDPEWIKAKGFKYTSIGRS